MYLYFFWIFLINDGSGCNRYKVSQSTSFWYLLSRISASSLDITCEMQLIKRITKEVILQRFRQNLNSKEMDLITKILETYRKNVLENEIHPSAV